MRSTVFSSAPNERETRFMKQWASGVASGRLESSPRRSSEVPFSFLSGERSSREWLKLESSAIESESWKDGKRRSFLRWRDEESGLSCEMAFEEFELFPAMEWVVRIRNEGSRDSAPISSFKALDAAWRSPVGEIPELFRSFGSDAREDDFLFQREELRQSLWTKSRTVRMDSTSERILRKTKPTPCPDGDGRPSSTWLPFFNLKTGSDGLLVGLGWSGRWFAEFAHDGEGSTAVSAGMENLMLSLRPGESLRSPRVLLLHWSGELLHAQNLFRKFILSFHCPQRDGAPVLPPLSNPTWGGTPAKEHLAMISMISERKLPCECYWIDAGWYGTSVKPCPDVFSGDWATVGDWRVNKTYHPDGLKPVSAAARAAGMKFLLWMEPERATQGTPSTLEHPEWFLAKGPDAPKKGDNMLFDIGSPEAREWMLGVMSSLIKENGIDWHREDFNLDPAPYWEAEDAKFENRRGAAELRFVEGLYAFWDELLRRNPGLLIDSCGGGGRRLELEALSRSVTLWRSDYNCFSFINPDVSQAHSFGLASWIPMNATSPFAKAGDTYKVRSAYSAGLNLSLGEIGNNRDYLEPSYPWGWHRAMLEEAKRLKRFFYGDFLPLSSLSISPSDWCVFQLHLPEEDAGAVLAFRRPEARMASASFSLFSLESEARYELEDLDSGLKRVEAGGLLIGAGLTISLPEPRSSRIVLYRKAD